MAMEGSGEERRGKRQKRNQEIEIGTKEEEDEEQRKVE